MTRLPLREVVRAVPLCMALIALPLANADSPAAPTGLQSEVVFSEYSDYSRSEELVRRLFSPLTALRINRTATRLGKAFREQAIDLSHERFALYVPSAAPERGYALLVFVPPWSSAEVPPDWTEALESHGMIFVTAANSGNDTNVFDRREPLALLAVKNVTARYPVDPQRVYVGGFSGGSKVALRLALGYPDVFHGVLLNAGSDPIGDEHIPLPPADLVHRFQETMRVVYATGGHDPTPLNEDAHSRASLHQWCVFNVATVSEPWTGHKPAPAQAVSHALDLLAETAPVDARQLAECRARVEGEMEGRLREVQDLLAKGKSAAAHRLLDRIDLRYGGLAGPRSLALEAQ